MPYDPSTTPQVITEISNLIEARKEDLATSVQILMHAPDLEKQWFVNNVLAIPEGVCGVRAQEPEFVILVEQFLTFFSHATERYDELQKEIRLIVRDIARLAPEKPARLDRLQSKIDMLFAHLDDELSAHKTKRIGLFSAAKFFVLNNPQKSLAKDEAIASQAARQIIRQMVENESLTECRECEEMVKLIKPHASEKSVMINRYKTLQAEILIDELKETFGRTALILNMLSLRKLYPAEKHKLQNIFVKTRELWKAFNPNEISKGDELLASVADLILELNRLDSILERRNAEVRTVSSSAPTPNEATSQVRQTQTKAAVVKNEPREKEKKAQPPCMKQELASKEQDASKKETELRILEDRLREQQLAEAKLQEELREQELQKIIQRQNAAISAQKKINKAVNVDSTPKTKVDEHKPELPAKDEEFQEKTKAMIYGLNKENLNVLLEIFESNASQLHLRYTYTQLEKLAIALGAEVKQAGTGGTHRRFKFANMEFSATKKNIIPDPTAPVHGGTDGALLGIYVKNFRDFLANRFLFDVDLIRSAPSAKTSHKVMQNG